LIEVTGSYSIGNTVANVDLCPVFSQDNTDKFVAVDPFHTARFMEGREKTLRSKSAGDPLKLVAGAVLSKVTIGKTLRRVTSTIGE
jgi:hypothetical protein